MATSDAQTGPADGSAFEALFRLAPIGIVISSNEGRFVDANEAALRLLRRSRDELIGKTSVEVGLVSAEARQRTSDAMRSEGTVRELTLTLQTGSARDVLYSSTPIQLSGATHYITTFVDITDRKQTEERYRTLIETTNEGVSILDGEHRIVFANRRFEEILGYAPGELLGRSGFELLDEEGRANAPTHIATYRSGKPREGEIRLRRKDGSAVWIMFAATPLGGNDRPYAGLLSLIRDITDRKKAEDRVRALLEAAPDGMVVVGADDRVVLVNAQIERLFGYRRDELVGAPVHQLVRNGLGEANGEDRPARTRHLCGVRKDGVEFPVEISLSPLTTEDGPLIIASVRDVTERNAFQSRVIVRERMASLGTLAAGVAHEINNPLASVMANLELVADEMRTLEAEAPSVRLAEIQVMLAEAMQGAERVRTVVRGMQTFSSTDEERRSPLDVVAILEQSVDLVANEIKHRARLVKTLGKCAIVDANPTRLGQVFVNLLVNAAHAIPEGQADQHVIHVTSRMEGARVLVEVRDTGQGIPAAAIGHIFDPFFTTKDVGEGTGLGLSICHNIVNDLGGEIAVESEPGRGSVFRVFLAAKGAAPATPPPPRTASEAPRRSGEGRAGVLVVDDDPMIGSALRRLLSAEHDVTVARGGREALELLDENSSFDVILCDLMMPDLTGMDLHEHLVQRHPELVDRIIFITGGAFTPAARAFLARVPNERLAKPFSSDLVRGAIRRVLR